METYSTQVMELLSLGRTSSGVSQMKIAVTQDDKYATYVIEMDEFTFLELEALGPLHGDRIRISPYSKWDPYRKSYYSSIIRTTGSIRVPLYFACSEAYVHMIQQIRQGELAPVPPEVEMKIAEVLHGNPSRTKLRSRFSARLPKIAVAILIMVGLLAILSIATGGRVDSARMLGGQVAKAKVTSGDSTSLPAAHASTSAVSGSSMTALSRDGAVITADQTVAEQDSVPPEEQEKQSSFTIIDIDEKKKFFGLSKEYVALTFDDGPSKLTKEIVDILTEQKVPATFLFIGQNVAHHEEAVTYASKQGMSIGNHSWDHSIMTKFTLAAQSENLSKANKAIEALTHTPVTLFRPPYGAVNDDLISAANKQQMKTLLWNRDPEDWNAKNPEDIIRYFHHVEAAGGIYVLHEDKNTLEALPAIINYLKSKDLTFVAFR
ncbi:Peptidoglycan/xylan/chitin deacetylase, PgdA/CDA1 family [Paenibacillus catalpae]|uniref:Peptidoglycan/xylan/chitin deacetylase, PgdA/CDA1 family n=1 Tax=Paenibacillus catalpae TaxID=1045775 RepID=A0A1I2GL73_9BACL|nr:polysaccharide deacetylase family protein [Paenibacillus catalpae]SFF17750.1 Peptidoglycan/xylan/chitin deacetylase, PgdA/CDA1 family [Paenibacillus catalpae]